MDRITFSTIAIVLVASLSFLAHTCVSTSPDEEKMEYLVPTNQARAIEHLPPVTWNESLEAFARSYANQRAGDCLLEHSQAPDMGECLAMGPDTLNPALAVKLWVDEKANYDYGTNTCKEGTMCGHYTQVVWKNTTSIGCANVKCNNGDVFITCNYYPPGNYIGEKPF